MIKNQIIKKINLIINVVILLSLFIVNLLASTSNYFEEGKKFFDEKKLEKSKFLFEKDIVFNPKSENSYLFLAKIYNKEGKKDEEESNLKNVLLINPQNDEAMYMLTILKIDQSDYKMAKELIEKFDLICKDFCEKKTEMKNKFDKLNPKDAKKSN